MQTDFEIKNVRLTSHGLLLEGFFLEKNIFISSNSVFKFGNYDFEQWGQMNGNIQTLRLVADENQAAIFNEEIEHQVVSLKIL